MYADKITKSMKEAINETTRRRTIQEKYNKKHHITPKTIEKKIHDIAEHIQKQKEAQAEKINYAEIPKEEISRIVTELKKEMNLAAKNLEFEKAAELRDEINKIRYQAKK